MATPALSPFQLANLSAAPSSPSTGWAYYDTALGVARVYTGSAWVSMSTVGVPMTASTLGAPTTGTWTAGSSVVDSSGVVWNCYSAGTPGLWAHGSKQPSTRAFGRMSFR